MRAERRGTKYLLGAPARVGKSLLKELVREAEEGKAVLAGFDFAMGLLVAYAKRAREAAAEEGLDLGESFLDALEKLPPEFFLPGDEPHQISWRRPFFANSSAGWTRLGLLGLGKGEKHRHVARRILGDADATSEWLLRAAERPHALRPHRANALFLLSGPAQVGKASISGWRELLFPAIREYSHRVRVWPFHGRLNELVRPGTVTLVETYPAECYVQLGIGDKNKTSQAWRTTAARKALDIARARDVLAAEALRELAASGFGPGKKGEDPFDAMIGAVWMALIALGHGSAGHPEDAEVLRWEGWILGRPGP